MSVTSMKRWAAVVLTAATGLAGLAGLQNAWGGKPAPPPPPPRVISYLHGKNTTGVVDAHVMDVNGGSSLTLTGDLSSSSYLPFPPRWSPNGQRLLFSSAASAPDSGTVLLSVAADGTGLQVLLTSAQAQAFVLSNSSQHIAADDHFGASDWSPDGQWVVFSLGVTYQSHVTKDRLFAVRIADRFMVQITDDDPLIDSHGHEGPRWSESLNMIAYVSFDGGAPAEEFELWVIAPDGTGRRQLIAPYSNTVISYPIANWCHSGNPQTGESSLAFGSLGEVLVIDINLSAQNPITGVEAISIPNYYLYQPAWSPDDTQLVMRRDASGVQQIATYDLSSGTSRVLQQVSTSRESLAGPDWRAAP